ncbi:MAG: hypothetical protein MUC36_03760 [Planctomycetes bacterium]|jgi:hypothetical protein|nr:hypothetical protein [Planctomycetota bacterium]
MPKPIYVKHERVYLKDHPDFTEAWLQDQITADPSILGLPGQPQVLARERRQDRAGRLDLLLYDRKAERRFELELMLGSLDESHIVRAIEYWDIERRHYPSYDHVAVLVAEDVTSRFLNVLSLLAGSIPLIVMQCNALRVGDQLLLHFVKVLDQTSLRRDDEETGAGRQSSRADWIQRVGEATIAMCEEAVTILNQKAKTKFQLNFTQGYLGLKDDVRSRNLAFFEPKKKFTHLGAIVANEDAWVDRLEAADLEATASRGGGKVVVTLTPKEFADHKPLLTELLQTAVAEYEA